MTTDHLGNLHGDNGRFTDKPHTQPGPEAQLQPIHVSQCSDQFEPDEADVITEVDGSVPVVDFEDPRLADALGMNPYDLGPHEQQALRALLTPNVIVDEGFGDYYGEDFDDPDEEADVVLGAFEEFDDEDMYELGKIAAVVCQQRSYNGGIDFDRSEGGPCEGYTAWFDSESGVRLAASHDIKYLDAARSVGTATGLRKAVHVYATMTRDVDALEAEAKRQALHDVDLHRTTGLGRRARRISATEAQARLDADEPFWRLDVTAEGLVRRDDLGTVQVRSVRYDSVAARHSSDGHEVAYDAKGAAYFATDASGATYVLDADDNPLGGFLPA